MGLIGIVLIAILVISAVLLVLVVLVQDEQGEGIGGIFGGGSSTAFGSRSGNVLTRFTAILAAIFLFCCFGVAWINRMPSAGNVIGKARQQDLSQTDQQNWWVQPSSSAAAATSTAASGTPSSESTGSSTTATGASTTSPAAATPQPATSGQGAQ